uniref:Os01g0276700 protein n=1 Tax=Macrostomum lignano TaxID=282301 RepID=A0A1I8FLW2_9PLAT
SVQAKRRVATKSERLFTAAALPVFDSHTAQPPRNCRRVCSVAALCLHCSGHSSWRPLAAPPRLVAALEGALTADDANRGVPVRLESPRPVWPSCQTMPACSCGVNLRDCRQPPSSQPREPSGSVETAVVELVNRTGGWAGNDSHFIFSQRLREGADADSNRPRSPSSSRWFLPSAGAIIAALFLVAAVMRFRRSCTKRRQMEKELQSLRKKSIECRLSEAAAASRSRNSAVAEPPFFIVDFASLDNVQELDAMSNPSESGDLDRSSLTQSEEFAQGAAVAVTTAPAAAAASIAADSNSVSHPSKAFVIPAYSTARTPGQSGSGSSSCSATSDSHEHQQPPPPPAARSHRCRRRHRRCTSAIRQPRRLCGRPRRRPSDHFDRLAIIPGRR